MSLWTSSISVHPPKKSNAAAVIIARQDRIPIWSLSYLFIGIIGMGFLFTFFDIGDINVSFVETCIQLVPGCLPQTASHFLGLPALANLVGYMLGALIFSPLADRFGRRDLLVLTMVITSFGSLYSALAGDYTNFVLSRGLTGIGVGADLVLVNTYINEVAPSRGRVKYTSLIFLMGAAGSSLGIWLGLYLTTPAAPFPFGLPFALASQTFTIGWRVMYVVGSSLAVFGLLLRFELPESPRWLISQGRLTEAERVVERMERRALTRIPELPPVGTVLPVQTATRRVGYFEIFSNPLYLKRTIFLLVIWLLGYIMVYSMVAGVTSILATLGYTLSEAGIISAIGTLGSILCALIAYSWGERIERKYWLLIAALISLLGSLIFSLGGKDNTLPTFVGIFINGCGNYLWLPILYTWSTENYPTRARATGFALVDGLGHVGGGVGMSYVLSFVSRLGPFLTFFLLSFFLLVAACLALFGTPTRQKRLDEVSP